MAVKLYVGGLAVVAALVATLASTVLLATMTYLVVEARGVRVGARLSRLLTRSASFVPMPQSLVGRDGTTVEPASQS